MVDTQPIYTEKAECQDCYKCLRACPFKAIRILNGSATVITEACILCGRCTEVCPVGAKKIRDDLVKAKELLNGSEPVYASLAPSFRTEFNGLAHQKLISAIMELGFSGVSETALGAQEVTAFCASLLKKDYPKLLISSACPSIVHLIEQYYPNLTEYITPFISPLQVHSQILKAKFGDNIKIVFFGPCIAKKNESLDFFDYALTFKDLRRWFTQNRIDWSKIPASGEFMPYVAGKGALYPVDGGMIDGIRNFCRDTDIVYMSFSGVPEVMSALEDLTITGKDKPIFIEALACAGGCINGPGTSVRGTTINKRYEIVKSASSCDNYGFADYERVLHHHSPREIISSVHKASEISAALLRIGKKRFEDELNCGGCGYNKCREFAAALIEDKAEPSMCVSYLRKLAQNKAAALIKAMPSGVVIIDDQLRIIESNQRFIDLIGGHADIVSLADPDLEGVYLDKLVPFYKHFKEALNSGNSAKILDIRHNNKIMRLTVFSIQTNHIVGGILQDVTEPVIQREQIIQKAGEVMKKNLNTVQKIAFLLGENAAESEILLNSIIESFSTKG